MADQVRVNTAGIIVARQSDSVIVNTAGVIVARQSDSVIINTAGVMVAYGTDRAETSQFYTQVEYTSPPAVETSRFFTQVEYTPARVEISQLTSQVEWEYIPQAEISQLFAQVEFELTYLTPSAVSVIKGTKISGNVNSVQVDDAEEYVLQETATTPGLDIVFTYSNVQATNPKVIHFKAWYEGDESHSVKLQIKKNDQTWEDVVDALFPNAASEQSYSWDVPTPITDYVYDSLLQARATQVGNGSTERKLHVNFTNLTDKQGGGGGLRLTRSLSL